MNTTNLYFVVMRLSMAIFFVLTLVLTSCQKGERVSAPILASTTIPALAKEAHIHIVWEDNFESAEKEKIKSWITTVFAATEKTLGRYPFEVYFYIHRSTSHSEPVPWAHTTRGEKQGVHFHVNPEFTLQEFLDDWTAAHEMSHLSLPFVGKKNSWFSEGYATFMQYQIMQTQGIYTAEQVEAKYISRLKRCKNNYNTNSPLPMAADSLKQKWNYADMYWGGVTYFWNMDKALKSEKSMALTELVQQYVGCCRVDRGPYKEIIVQMDSLLGSTMCMDMLKKVETEPAFMQFKNVP